MPPKKRKGSGKQAETQSKQPKQEGQKAVSHDVNIPLDEGFHDDRMYPPKSPVLIVTPLRHDPVSLFFNSSVVIGFNMLEGCNDQTKRSVPMHPLVFSLKIREHSR